jgi:hypothetical protein
MFLISFYYYDQITKMFLLDPGITMSMCSEDKVIWYPDHDLFSQNMLAADNKFLYRKTNKMQQCIKIYCSIFI